MPFLRLLAFSVIVGPCSGFYLPGVAPREYPTGTLVDLKVNKLTSSKAQLPYGYYTLPFCKPKAIQQKVENLGEILMGDEIENSPYELKMMINESCKLLCRVPLDDAKRELFRNAIDDDYMVNWIVDNLPAATRFRNGLGDIMLAGHPVGHNEEGKYSLHNHVSIKIYSHTNPEKYEDYRIVGFEVEPISMRQAVSEDENGDSEVQCQDDDEREDFRMGKNSEIIFTYDVRWVESPIRWASRWDQYLKSSGGQIHWFSILNSLLIVICLTVMIALILVRTLYRDIAKYNEIATDEDAKEETGWKIVHGDVFREPKNCKLLCVSVGSGLQLFGMALVTLVFALGGFLSPARRGALLQSMMLVFTFMGIFAGYSMARLYKVFDKSDWRVVTLLTAVFYPGMVFIVFFILNLMIWEQKSSGAVPFMTMFAMLVLWFGVSVPLVFLGAYYGFNVSAIELPVRISKIPRMIPESTSWASNQYLMYMAGGSLPFAAIFTELFFIMSSIWQHQYYYLFGFLALVMLILIITCSEVSIAFTYMRLTSEDYRWWWVSFFVSASSGVWLFLNSILYFYTRLSISHLAGSVLYFGYMGVMSLCFGLMTGSIGFCATFIFVKAIYGSIKID